MRVYISGPMSGLAYNNVQSFNDAENYLKDLGHEVSNPAGQEDRGQTWSQFLKADLVELIVRCDAVYVLPGWTKSEGACLEICVAQALGIPVCDRMYSGGVPIREIETEIIMAVNLSPKPRRKDR